MHLLYLDESGQPDGDHFVLAGVTVFERQTYWLSKALDDIQRELFPDITEPVEFHASVIRAGRADPWCQLTKEQQRCILDSVYTAIADSKAVVFGVAVDKGWLDPGTDAYLFAFECLLKKFDDFLRRLYNEGNEQRGLVVIAESQFRERIESLAIQLRSHGTRWGELYNLVEIPLFTPARYSRLLQVADFCANAIHGRYNGGFSRQFDVLARSFDSEGGILHGMSHYTRQFESCMCPACLSRRLRG